jgi:hypothetical protein
VIKSRAMMSCWTSATAILCDALRDCQFLCSVSWILLMFMELHYRTINWSGLNFLPFSASENYAYSSRHDCVTTSLYSPTILLWMLSFFTSKILLLRMTTVLKDKHYYYTLVPWFILGSMYELSYMCIAHINKQYICT